MDMNEEEKKLNEDTDSEIVENDSKEGKENEFQSSDSVSNFAVYCGNELLKKKKAPKFLPAFEASLYLAYRNPVPIC